MGGATDVRPRLTSLHRRIGRFVAREGLVPESGRLAVALSGGGDSVAMTVLLRELSTERRFHVVGIAHLNHRLRPDADGDESFCRKLADQLGLPIVVEAADVRDVARRQRISIEEAGHRERYRFFARALDGLGADRMATAHTRDDQAETYVMRMLRGAGPRGLAGIRPSTGRVIRPLLDVSRNELRTFLRERGQTYMEDETNLDLRVTRNRVRHELMPLLERRFSPSVAETLARGAQIARRDSEWLEAAAALSAESILTYRGDAVEIDRAKLSGQPNALASRIIKRALEHVSGVSAGFDDVERLLRPGGEDCGVEMTLDMPACAVRCSTDRLIIGPPRPRQQVTRATFEYRLPIPGEVGVKEVGMVLSARRVSGCRLADGLTPEGRTACLDARHLTGELAVRSWQPGDALRPLGLGGRKKLQDLFVDRKVPQSERARVPIVVDKGHGIVWVVGHAVAEDFRVTPASEGMLILKARSLGGAG